MGEVRTFEGYVPPARVDHTPWTSVIIGEAATEDGIPVTIDTITFDDPDADPANPAPRSFTTSEATLDPAWYTLTWIDDLNGTFTDPPVPFPALFATDSKDIRVMVPRVRRALVGPTGSGFEASEINDSDTVAAIADALANVMLYSNGGFGKQLVVTARDGYYLAPVAWATSDELTEVEQSIVAIQAALDYIGRSLATAKASQTIRNEGQEWSYALSANALTERLKGLRADRDRALAILEIENEGMEQWISYIQVRDSYTSALIEPYTTGNSGRGGQVLDAWLC